VPTAQTRFDHGTRLSCRTPGCLRGGSGQRRLHKGNPLTHKGQNTHHEIQNSALERHSLVSASQVTRALEKTTEKAKKDKSTCAKRRLDVVKCPLQQTKVSASRSVLPEHIVAGTLRDLNEPAELSKVA
jgi:hypothetical protein